MLASARYEALACGETVMMNVRADMAGGMGVAAHLHGGFCSYVTFPTAWEAQAACGGTMSDSES